jgi:Ca2+-transporting ATPase
VFFEFVIDPTCSIVFEAEEGNDDVMRQPPRDPAQRLFSLRIVALSVLQGCAVLVAVALVYGWGLAVYTAEAARSMAFVTIVLGNLGLILANRSQMHTIAQMMRVPNTALWWVLGATLAAMVIAVYVPAVRELFRFAPLDPAALALCAGAAAASLVWFELYKWVRRPAAAEGSAVPDRPKSLS